MNALSFHGDVPLQVIIENPETMVTGLSCSKARIFHPRFLARMQLDHGPGCLRWVGLTGRVCAARTGQTASVRSTRLVECAGNSGSVPSGFAG